MLDVLAAGVCGTDLHIEADEFRSVPPVTMGHEVCGVVSAVGAGVDPRLAGRPGRLRDVLLDVRRVRVVSRRPDQPLPRRRSIGSFVDGAFARQVIVPESNLHRIPDWLDDYAAALSEPLACVCNCLFDPPKVTPAMLSS